MPDDRRAQLDVAIDLASVATLIAQRIDDTSSASSTPAATASPVAAATPTAKGTPAATAATSIASAANAPAANSLAARGAAIATAFALFDRSIAMREAVAASDPNDVQSRIVLARVLSNAARWRLRLGDPANAQRDATRALAIVQPLLPTLTEPAPRVIAARALLVRANVHARDDRRALACNDLSRANSLAPQLPPALWDGSDRDLHDSARRSLTFCAGRVSGP